MKKYQWRKVAHVRNIYQNKEIRAKLACKTEDIRWVGTRDPIIVPISIHSSFHEEPYGTLKFEFLVSVIREFIPGKVTFLVADRAHLNVLLLKYRGDQRKALEICYQDRQLLLKRYETCLEGLNIVFWEDFISQNKNYSLFKQQIQRLFEKDLNFRQHVYKDAEETYTFERRQDFPNQELYLQCAVQDILEHGIYTLISAHEGYRFELYPGKAYLSCQYLSQVVLKEHGLAQIYLFLSVERSYIKELNHVDELCLQSNI